MAMSLLRITQLSGNAHALTTFQRNLQTQNLIRETHFVCFNNFQSIQNKTKLKHTTYQAFFQLGAVEGIFLISFLFFVCSFFKESFYNFIKTAKAGYANSMAFGKWYVLFYG